MKQASLLLFIPALLIACSNPSNASLQARVDSLEKKIAFSYKPGLGEFMSSMQVHHAKLWFAGQNENWKLADFEINEIREALDDIPKFCIDRPEVKSIGIVLGPVDSISKAIEQKNAGGFKNNYVLLTNTCNNCHRETEHEFNVITIPTTPPVSNQKF